MADSHQLEQGEQAGGWHDGSPGAITVVRAAMFADINVVVRRPCRCYLYHHSQRVLVTMATMAMWR